MEVQESDGEIHQYDVKSKEHVSNSDGSIAGLSMYTSDSEEDEQDRCTYRILNTTRLLNASKHNDPCMCTTAQDTSNSLSGWGPEERPAQENNSKKRRQKRKKHNLFRYYPLDSNIRKNGNLYKFRHFKDLSRYIEQYRYFHTDGDVGKGYAEDRTLGEDLPDPYMLKLKRYNVFFEKMAILNVARRPTLSTCTGYVIQTSNEPSKKKRTLSVAHTSSNSVRDKDQVDSFSNRAFDIPKSFAKDMNKKTVKMQNLESNSSHPPTSGVASQCTPYFIFNHVNDSASQPIMKKEDSQHSEETISSQLGSRLPMDNTGSKHLTNKASDDKKSAGEKLLKPISDGNAFLDMSSVRVSLPVLVKKVDDKDTRRSKSTESCCMRKDKRPNRISGKNTTDNNVSSSSAQLLDIMKPKLPLCLTPEFLENRERLRDENWKFYNGGQRLHLMSKYIKPSNVFDSYQESFKNVKPQQKVPGPNVSKSLTVRPVLEHHDRKTSDTNLKPSNSIGTLILGNAFSKYKCKRGSPVENILAPKTLAINTCDMYEVCNNVNKNVTAEEKMTTLPNTVVGYTDLECLTPRYNANDSSQLDQKPSSITLDVNRRPSDKHYQLCLMRRQQNQLIPS